MSNYSFIFHNSSYVIERMKRYETGSGQRPVGSEIAEVREMVSAFWGQMGNTLSKSDITFFVGLEANLERSLQKFERIIGGSNRTELRETVRTIEMYLDRFVEILRKDYDN